MADKNGIPELGPLEFLRGQGLQACRFARGQLHIIANAEILTVVLHRFANFVNRFYFTHDRVLLIKQGSPAGTPLHFSLHMVVRYATAFWNK